MEWVLFVSLQWVVFGSPTPPNTVLIEPFASEELCKRAADCHQNRNRRSVSRTATRSDDGTRDMSATEGKVAEVSAQGLETCPGPLRRYQSTVRGDTDRGSSAIFTRGVQTATGWTIRLRSPILYAFTHALK